MGGGFMFSANSATFSAASPPSPTPTPAVCAQLQPCYCSENDTFFGPVPSRVEVETAILELQRFMHDLSTTKSEQMHHHFQSSGFIKFSEAFAMMQAEPPLRNLVTSISCDEAVWEAMLSNKAVASISAAAKEEEKVVSMSCPNKAVASISAAAKEEEKVVSMSCPNKADLSDVMLKWIVGLAKSKVLQLLESFASLVAEIFQPPSKEKHTSQLDDLLDEKVRSSLLLSVVILLVVVVVRGQP